MKAVKCMLAVFLVKLLTITNAMAPSDYEPPKIIEGPLNTTVVSRSRVIFKCRASGNPKPTIYWEANGHIPLNKTFQILPSGDLKIQRVYYYDSGEYTCNAVNEYGTAKESARLDVKQKTRIYVGPGYKEVGVAQTATMTCEESHDESLSIKQEWLKDGEPIDYKNQKRYSKLSNNSLTISNTIGQDSGRYTCEVRTDVDVDRAVTYLAVQDVPNAPILEDVICNGLRAEIIWKPQGDNHSPIMSYHVEYNITSFASQSWEVGQSTVHSNQTKYTYSMFPWATYSFRVIAQNEIGLSPPSKHAKSCTTQPDVPRESPKNVKTEADDPTKLVITWTPMPEIEHSGPKFHYRVFWKRDIPDAEWESKDVFNWKENKVIVSGQPMFVEYIVKVVAINELGESKIPAEDYFGYSGEDRPLLAPKNFKMLTLESSTSAVLKWDPVSPESLRGQFKGYKLQTWTADEIENVQEVKVDSHTNEIYFTQLIPYSKNFVRLCAYNSRFDGPGTVISIDTPESFPSPIQNLEAYVLSESDVLVTWDKPLKPNGRLTGYKVYYEEIQGGYYLERIETDHFLHVPQITSSILTDLKPNTEYRISVSAGTAAGVAQGIYADAKTLPQGREPKEPLQPNFKWDTQLPNSIRVYWQPFNGYPTGTHFFTQYRAKGRTEWNTIHEQNEKRRTTFQIIRGLNPDTVYEMRVVSVDGKFKKESEIQEVKIIH